MCFMERVGTAQGVTEQLEIPVSTYHDRPQGFEVGGCRLPQGSLAAEHIATLRAELDAIGFFEWSQTEVSELAS